MSLADAPCELQCGIKEFWPESEWENAAAISQLESGWDGCAVADTRTESAGCGTVIGYRNGVAVSAEYSIGYFQINACNYPNWDSRRFFNARENCGTAHALWAQRGWQPWYFSATKLGLI